MIEVSVLGKGIEQVRKALQRLEKERRRDIAKIWRARLKEASLYGRQLIKQLFSGRGKRLQRAFSHRVRVRPDDVIGRVGYLREGKRSSAYLGRFYEKQGGFTSRIRSKTQAGKKLWVPVGANRGASGDPIMTPREYFASLRGQSFIRTTPAGNRVAFRNVGGVIEPMFVLKDEVRHQSRPVIPSVKSKFMPMIIDETGAQVFSYFRGIKA